MVNSLFRSTLPDYLLDVINIAAHVSSNIVKLNEPRVPIILVVLNMLFVQSLVNGNGFVNSLTDSAAVGSCKQHAIVCAELSWPGDESAIHSCAPSLDRCVLAPLDNVDGTAALLGRVGVAVSRSVGIAVRHVAHVGEEDLEVARDLVLTEVLVALRDGRTLFYWACVRP